MKRLVLDACILVKGNVSNVFFDLATSGLVSLHWTNQIATEFVKNWTRIHLEIDGFKNPSDQEYLVASTKKQHKALHRLKMFGLMQREWRIPGWNSENIENVFPASKFNVGIKNGVDGKDLHVAQAAASLAKAFPDDEIWLVTENIKDLPSPILFSHRVWSVHQGLALNTLFFENPDAIAASIEKTINDTRTPSISKSDMLRVIAASTGFGDQQLSDALSKKWGIVAASRSNRKK